MTGTGEDDVSQSEEVDGLHQSRLAIEVDHLEGLHPGKASLGVDRLGRSCRAAGHAGKEAKVRPSTAADLDRSLEVACCRSVLRDHQGTRRVGRTCLEVLRLLHPCRSLRVGLTTVRRTGLPSVLRGSPTEGFRSNQEVGEEDCVRKLHTRLLPHRCNPSFRNSRRRHQHQQRPAVHPTCAVRLEEPVLLDTARKSWVEVRSC